MLYIRASFGIQGPFSRRGDKNQRNDRQVSPVYFVTVCYCLSTVNIAKTFICGGMVVPQVLHEEWANYGVMHKYQPVDLIRLLVHCHPTFLFSRELALIRVAGDLDSTLTKKKRHG